MLIPVLLLFMHQQVERIFDHELPNPGGTPRLKVFFQPDKREDPGKLSPKKFGPSHQPFEFDFVTYGLGKVRDNPNYQVRFRVFEQQRKEQFDLTVPVTRLLLRLWEYNYYSLGWDHLSIYNDRKDDVYLCWGGTPGGEQAFDVDYQVVPPARPYKVNTIYIYDLPSFKDPVEMVREVAHEYGHASVPPIGGYKEPEYWANGYFGEKLFMLYLYKQLQAGALTPDDTMGATATQIGAWISKNINPLILRASAHGSDQEALTDTSKEGMDAYMGLALYMSQILPPHVFSRSMVLVGSYYAKDYPASILMACQEPDSYPLDIPLVLRNRDLWVPIDKAKVEGATVLKRNDGWALIHPTSPAVTIVNR